MKPFLSRTVLLLLSILLAGPGQARSVLSDILHSARTDDARAFVKSFNALDKTDQQLVVRSLDVERIVGGQLADIDSNPWQVALIRGYAPEPQRSQFCGGALVSPVLVITAAHCVDNSIVRKDHDRIAVVAGTAFYAAGGERIAVAAIYVHPQWNGQTLDDDVAILKLAVPSRLGKPVALDTATVAAGTWARVTGWGSIIESGPGSPDLLTADVPIVDTATCQPSFHDPVTSHMLCAGSKDGGVDACQGDSGGPLVVGKDANARLIGLVSWGEGCARKGKYGVYTDVASPDILGWVSTFVGSAQAASLSAISPPARSP